MNSFEVVSIILLFLKFIAQTGGVYTVKCHSVVKVRVSFRIRRLRPILPDRCNFFAEQRIYRAGFSDGGPTDQKGN